MTRFYTIPQDHQADVEALEQAIKAFTEGKMDPVRFRAVRVGMGVYEQRSEDSFMIRVRAPGGAILPSQLAHVARLSSQYGDDHLHVTTRREFQVHGVPLQQVMKVVSALPEVGLSSKGGGGNTIRNIVSSTHAGIDPNEPFDTTPYVVALTDKMLAEPDSFNLPRKVKIAFSSTWADSGLASLSCLGFVAGLKEGRPGFKVFVAGGMGAKSYPGKVLHEWIEAGELYAVVRAFKTMFDKHGNRRNKLQNRVRFLWEKLGQEAFMAFYQAELDALRETGYTPLALPDLGNSAPQTGITPQQASGPEYELWKSRHVMAQKQPGFVSVRVPLHLGDIHNGDAIKLAELVAPFGDDTIRFSKDQNIHLRNIPQAFLGNVYHGLQGLHTHMAKPVVLGKMVSCTGASTCKLGICLSRGMTAAIDERLSNSGLNLDGLGALRINISGCPNSCGQHHSADLGFFGKVQRVEGEMLPAYNVLAGARVSGDGGRLGRKVAEVNAKDAPRLVEEVMKAYLEQQSAHPLFADWVDNGGEQTIAQLAGKYAKPPTFAAGPDYYTDWGAAEKFSMVARGMGECSAGLFDLIDVDVKAIATEKKLLEDPAIKLPDAIESVRRMLLASARMLLVTRGIEAATDAEILRQFQRHFIEAGLVGQQHTALVKLAQQYRYDLLLQEKEGVAALADEMVQLYNSMDNSLRFPAETQPKGGASPA